MNISLCEEHDVEVSGTRLHYVRTDLPRPPLLMLHGVTRCWQTYLPLLPTLAQRWQIYALDFRGHGRSQHTPGKYHVVDYVRETVAFLREVVGEPAMVYGHSLGAMVAAGVAAEAPEQVLGLVVEDPPFHTMGERYFQTSLASYFAGMQKLTGSTRPLTEVAKALADLHFENPETGESVRLGDVRDEVALRFQAMCLARVDPQVLAPIVNGQWLEGYDWQTFARNIACPTLLLQADAKAGGMLTDEDAQLFASAIGDCMRVFYAGANHSLHWTRTDELLLHVSQFLETIPSTRAPNDP